MGNRKKIRRDKLRGEKTRKSQGASAAQATMPELLPSAQTLFRYGLVDAQTRELMAKGAAATKPMVWKRDEDAVRRIEAAKSIEELIDLLPVARGLAEQAWVDRMERFEDEAVPASVAKLKAAENIPDEGMKQSIYELLLGYFRWRGDVGAKAVLEAFDSLDDYGRSLACVVLGLLKAKASADRIWSFYQQVKLDRNDTYLVGALWGLIDLQDERASGALFDLLREAYVFDESFGFLSLAGDSRAVLPLLAAATLMPKDRTSDPLMALISIAHRIGRQAFMVELDKTLSPKNTPQVRESLVNQLLAAPLDQAQEYFATFYRGLKPDELAQGLQVLGRLRPT